MSAKPNEETVTDFTELEDNVLYRINGGTERKHFFTVEGFYWVGADDETLGIGEEPDPTVDGVDPEQVDESNSFVSIHYFDGYYSDTPIQNLKEHIQDGRYLKIGELESNRHLIPDN